MGLFGTIKESIEEKTTRQAYINMNQEALLALDNEELYEAILTRVEHVAKYMDVDECLEKLKVGVRVFYIVNYYEAEVNNGGLCQYFVNSSRKTAPFILGALGEIGAHAHAKLLADFVETNEISLDDLSSFVIDDMDEYEAQEARYPFDDFDNAFYELYDTEHLSDVLVEYVRKHIDEFAE